VNETISPPATLETKRPRRSIGAWIMAVVLFAVTLALDTRHNDFPFSYHPDEGGKVIQVMRGERNYHHPLLLLSTTAVVSHLGFVPHDPQAIVRTGRWVSAGFAAGSVVAFALIAWWNYGLLVGWSAGLAIALQEDLFELAHYMKEDPVLLFGLALALLAAHVWWRYPARRSLYFLAIACGIATAGKYLGIVSIFFALPLVIWHRAADPVLTRAARVRVFLFAFALAFLVCNIPIFSGRVSSPFRSVGNEMKGVAGGHQGLTRKVPHAEYLKALKSKVPPLVLGLAGIYALALLVTARRRTPPEWVTLIFPIAFLAIISCSPKIAERYLLPVSAMLPLLAALGAGEIGRLIAGDSRVRQVLSGVGVTVILVFLVRAELPTFRQFYGALRETQPNGERLALISRLYVGFQHDDPTAVANWVKQHVPASAIIAEDHRVNLSATKSDANDLGSPARVPQKVLDASFAPDLAPQTGTLDELRAKGVTYVAVCRQNYGRYYNDEMKPQLGVKSGYDKRREFYGQLFKEGKLEKEWPKGPITYLQPGIKLYSIAPAEVAPKAE
jgi:hypothetical protein